MRSLPTYREHKEAETAFYAWLAAHSRNDPQAARQEKRALHRLFVVCRPTIDGLIHSRRGEALRSVHGLTPADLEQKAFFGVSTAVERFTPPQRARNFADAFRAFARLYIWQWMDTTDDGQTRLSKSKDVDRDALSLERLKEVKEFEQEANTYPEARQERALAEKIYGRTKDLSSREVRRKLTKLDKSALDSSVDENRLAIMRSMLRAQQIRALDREKRMVKVSGPVHILTFKEMLKAAGRYGQANSYSYLGRLIGVSDKTAKRYEQRCAEMGIPPRSWDPNDLLHVVRARRGKREIR
jgi:hypothetical protein